MKIYDVKDFPNPRRVRMFLAEKGVNDVTYEQVDFSTGEHRKDPYLQKNPYGGIPVLELDDGTCISETVAICRYFDDQADGQKLMGNTPQEKANIEMWSRRVEDSILNTALAYFHHATDGLGPLENYQNVEWGRRNRDMMFAGIQKLDDQLANNQYVAGPSYSLADITAICAIDLIKWLGIELPAECVNLSTWYNNLSERPSMAA